MGVDEFRQILLWPLAIDRPPGKTTKEVVRAAAADVNRDPHWELVHDRLLHAGRPPAPSRPGQEGGPASAEPVDPYGYQEFVYFHDYVSRFLFGRQTEGDLSASSVPAFFLFRHRTLDGVEVVLAEGKPPLSLDVERCNLYLFRTGIAMLVLEVAARPSDAPWSLADVLNFSDAFRRTYTPWFAEAESGDTYVAQGVAHSVAWRFGDRVGAHHHPRSLADEWARLTAAESRLGDTFDAPVARQWCELLPSALAVAGDPGRVREGRHLLRHILDERMAVMSFVCLAEPIAHLRESDWVRLCFVDTHGDALPYSKSFLSDFDRLHAYDRFRDFGTRHLLSSYSYVLVTGGPGSASFLGDHFRRMYFQMALIAYHELAMYIAFSGRVAAAIDHAEGRGDVDAPEFREEILQAQREFLDFVHRFRFASVSTQIQAIELYALFRRHLRLAEIAGDVSSELETATTYLRVAEAADQSASAESLNVVAALGVTLGLTVSMLGALPSLVDRGKLGYALVAGTSLLFSSMALLLTLIAGARLGKERPARESFKLVRSVLCGLVVLSLVALLFAVVPAVLHGR